MFSPPKIFCELTYPFFSLTDGILIELLNDLLKKSFKKNVDLFTQPTFTCSKSTIETLEKVIEYVRS